MELQGTSRECNGAVFLLHSAPIQDAHVEIDGWTVKATKGADAVVAYGGGGPRTFTESYGAALTAANTALDYMSVRGLCDVQIRNAYDDCLVWWPDGADVVVRANVVWTQTFHASAKVSAVAADGTALPQVLPTVVKHDAFRFIRMSRTSEYLFDAYRNMFLAFEAVLSDIYPQPKGMKESAWFKEALRKADGLVPISPILAPSGVPSSIDWVYENVYRDARSALMHAKQGRAYHLPQDDRARQQLQASLNNMWLYIRGLLDTHLGVAHMSGGLFQGGFHMLAQPVLSGQIAAVTADATPLALNDERFAPTGKPIVELTSGPVVAAEPFLSTVLASCEAAELGHLPTIGRIGSTDTLGNLQVLSSMVGPLDLGSSVHRFEMMLGIRGVNAAGPRTHFSA